MSNKHHPIRDKDIWIRLVFLILYGIIFSIVQYLVFVVAVLQAVISLFSRTPNTQLQNFGSGLAEYARLLTRYLSYNTSLKPFPFSDWKPGDKPDANTGSKAQSAGSKKRTATASKTVRARKPARKRPASGSASTATTSSTTSTPAASSATPGTNQAGTNPSIRPLPPKPDDQNNI